jgi:hypothetical protein
LAIKYVSLQDGLKPLTSSDAEFPFSDHDSEEQQIDPANEDGADSKVYWPDAYSMSKERLTETEHSSTGHEEQQRDPANEDGADNKVYWPDAFSASKERLTETDTDSSVKTPNI